MDRRTFLGVGAFVASDAGAASLASPILATDKAGPIELPTFTSAVTVSSANIQDGIHAFRTAGYYSPDGQGAALYRLRKAPEAGGPGDILSNGGKKRWAYAEDVAVVKAFGARADGKTIDTQAVKAALAWAKMNGRAVNWGAGRYIIDDGIVLPATRHYGDGGGEWLAWSADLPKQPAPCELLFVGSGPRIHSLPLVSDMRTSGGVIGNPSSGNKREDAYRLTSFTNEDGSPRLFSAAVKSERSGRGLWVEGMRIVVNHQGAGEKYGIGGYNEPSNHEVGSDWDVGFWNHSAQNLIMIGVHVVGHWRMFGCLQTAVLDNNEKTSGRGRTGSEYCRYVSCNFHGAVGFGVRGGDTYRIVEVGADYVGIENASNLPFHNAQTGRVRIGPSAGNSKVHSYSVISVAESTLRLRIKERLRNVAVGHCIVANIYGFGISNTVLQDCEVSGFNHPSGIRATRLTTPLPNPSAAFEGSGSFVRGLTFRGTKFIGIEDVLWHMHDISDVTMDGQTMAEAKPDAEGTVGGRCIASPTPSANRRVASPMGQTNGLRMEFVTSQTNSAVDLRPRSRLAPPSRFAGARDFGFFEPQSMRWIDQALPLDRLNVILAARPGGSLVLRDDAGVTRVLVRASGALTRISGDNSALEVTTNGTRPGTDNAFNLGAGAYRWAQIFAGAATINTSDEREKAQIRAISERVLDAWGDVRWAEYVWKDAVDAKADEARVHFGLIAQHVIAVFEGHRLDPRAFGLICYDEWPDEYEDEYEDVMVEIPNLTPDGEPTGEVTQRIERIATGRKILRMSAGSRYGIRYSEAFALEAAYQRRRIDRIEEKLADLTATN